MERAKEDIPDLRLVNVGPAACFSCFSTSENLFSSCVLCVSWWSLGFFSLGVNMIPNFNSHAWNDFKWVKLERTLTNAWEQADSTEEMENVNLFILLVDIWYMIPGYTILVTRLSYSLSLYPARHLSDSTLRTPCFGGPTSTAFTSKANLSNEIKIQYQNTYEYLSYPESWVILIRKTLVDLQSQVQVAHWHPMKLSLWCSWKGLSGNY